MINKAISVLDRLTQFSEYNVPVPKELKDDLIVPEVDDPIQSIISREC